MSSSPGFHGIESVQVKIEQDLGNSVLVDPGVKILFSRILFDADGLFRRLGFDHFQGVINQFPQRTALPFHGHGPGEIEELTDDPVQPLHFSDEDVGDFAILPGYPGTFP